MINLYTYDVKEKCYFYDGAWIDGELVHKHSGRLGAEGQIVSYPLDKSLSEEENLSSVLEPALRNGYRELDVDQHFSVLVEYAIDQLGRKEDVRKRFRLEEHVNDVLVRTGLGFCDGGSIGPGVMAARCFVIDLEVGKAIIEGALEDTEFADYTCIRSENV